MRRKKRARTEELGIDFGVDDDMVVESLEHLDELRRRYES